MKKFLTFFAAAALCGTMLACNSSSDDDDDDGSTGGKGNIVGSWEFVEVCDQDGDCRSSNDGIIEFYDDGTFTSQDGDGTWKLKGNTLKITLEGRNKSHTIKYEIIKLKEESMGIQREGSKKTLHLERR